MPKGDFASNQFRDLFSEAESMANFGIWEVDIPSMNLKWSEGVYAIHEVNPETFTPNVEDAVRFYSPESLPVLTEHFDRLLREGVPYDLNLELITATNQRIWVRTYGIPVFDEEGKVVMVRGIFQDIDQHKKSEVAWKKTLEGLSAKNERLNQFAHIVSHNLRSHAGNLELMLKMWEEADATEKPLFMQQIVKISQSLTQTISNLGEIVMMEKEEGSKDLIDIQWAIQKAEAALKAELERPDIAFKVAIEGWNQLMFQPAYLDSILLNLISNSIKYRKPDQPLEIKLLTTLEEGKKRLYIIDNGKGIDMQRYGNKLFGLYKTFHGNKDARGIGLFITKSQIESMGGRIWAESEPDQGTRFCIEFQ
ncbi:MAG: PAS domain-containing sensor histidine kinase [Bacteroidota bacterium]|nr:PAS domain-containing sensor histidine kinase [Bacteroidota bacterium]MDX5429612.1 PAS domain-containing sensor histidine kinase [Bacteroidota bacterium]MDX5468396.1 PAS domain-containing sensor histidine kinase [Bacteroidota bacterium]